VLKFGWWVIYGYVRLCFITTLVVYLLFSWVLLGVTVQFCILCIILFNYRLFGVSFGR